MDARAYYLRLTLEEQDAARNSTSAEARERHEELASAYEIRCLLDAPLRLSKKLKDVETAV
ncbi:MAG: hypothetical protein ACJ8F4_00110 [Sphingomonas sp.]|jgi:hypothetical protein